MRPLTVLAVAGLIAIVIAQFAVPWYTARAGATSLAFRPGKVTTCNADVCRTTSSDGADFDSTWLGLLGATPIAAGLGGLACAAIAAMAHQRRRQLGDGKVKAGHAIFLGLLGLGIVGGTVATKPAGVSLAAGPILALLGIVTGLATLLFVRDDASEPS